MSSNVCHIQETKILHDVAYRRLPAWRRFSFFSLFLVLFLAACSGRASQREDSADLIIELNPGALEVGPTTLEIRVEDGAGVPVDDATLEVTGDMTHAGMIPVLAEGISGGQDGFYQVPFEWTMGGDWIVTVVATLPDGRESRQQFDLTVERGMPGMGDG